MEWTHEEVEVPAWAGSKDVAAYDAYMMQRKRIARDYHLIAPSTMFGTFHRPLAQDDDGSEIDILMLDTLYRNNVFEFGAQLAEAESSAKKDRCYPYPDPYPNPNPNPNPNPTAKVKSALVPCPRRHWRK